MKEFTGRVAVITGGASGIGRAMADRFADVGMKIVLADIEEYALQQAELAMRAHGATVMGIVTDVSRAESVEALAEKTIDAFGGVHILCNNAGVGGGFGRSWTQPLQNWEWGFAVNLWGVVHGIRTFVPIMLKQDTEGHIINTSSIAGLISSPFLSVYDATKSAVITISESLYLELALQRSKIKVSVLCPGFVKTKLTTSDRNRPEHLQVKIPHFDEIERLFATLMSTAHTSAAPAAEVAEKVFDAIRNEQFYILPHAELLPALRMRMEAILNQQNPPALFDGTAAPPQKAD